jgi:plastocyanin
MRTPRTSVRSTLAALVLAVAAAACSTSEQPPAEGAGASASASAAAPAAAGEQTPDAGGRVVPIEMLTDDQGNNVFRPADVTAKRGDVLRYTLVSGVHNVHFLADSNPGKPGLPAASDMLQLNGQTYDVKVTWAPGRYYYQCDPHALLGMIGHVTIQ